MGCSSVISHFSQESLFYLLKLRKFNVEYTFVILSQIIQKYKSIHLLLLDNLRQKYKSIHLYLCYFWIFRKKILQIYIQKYEYPKVLKCQTQALTHSGLLAACGQNRLFLKTYSFWPLYFSSHKAHQSKLIISKDLPTLALLGDSLHCQSFYNPVSQSIKPL